MVPKGSSTVEPNDSSKGLSWVDRMYQKFEHICEEVDKNPTHLIQETTKYVENQVSIAGVNVRKLCAEVIQEILPPAPEVAIKSLSSIINVDLEEEFMLSEKLKPDPEKTNLLVPKSMDPCNMKQDFADVQKEPDCTLSTSGTLQKSFLFPQDVNSDFSSLNTRRQPPSSSLLETSAAEKQPMPLSQEARNHTEDACGIQERTAFGIAEPKMKQQREIIKLDVSILADKMGKTSLHEDNLEEIPETEERNSDTKDGQVEPSSADHPRFANLDCSLDEGEQLAYWYESDRIDISTSNSFYEVVDDDKNFNVENCDSDWEFL